MESPLIVCRGLTRVLPSGGRELTILNAIDLTIEKGEFVAILGPSGSGKSTLLALLAGLDRPSSGDVEVDGTALAGLDEDALALLRRDKIGFVFQSFHLFENLTARENILVPLELTGRAQADKRSSQLLERVGLLDRGHHYPAQLSGGEKQRIALARAFASEPAILLADEPTGNLDSETGERVLELLIELRERAGTTLVLVTHDPQIADRAPRRIWLHAGRIEREEGSVERVS